MTKTLVEMAAEIVQAQSSSKNMATEELQEALKETFSTLQNLQAMESGEQTAPAEEQKAAIAPEKSILKNKIICLECGEEFKTLSYKHLNSHGLSRREYRVKYGFSLRQPLCARRCLTAGSHHSGAEGEQKAPERCEQCRGGDPAGFQFRDHLRAARRGALPSPACHGQGAAEGASCRDLQRRR